LISDERGITYHHVKQTSFFCSKLKEIPMDAGKPWVTPSSLFHKFFVNFNGEDLTFDTKGIEPVLKRLQEGTITR